MCGNRKRKHTAWPEHASCLRESLEIVLDVLDDLAGGDGVECAIRIRKVGHVRQQHLSANTALEHGDRSGRDIRAHNLVTALFEQSRERPLAGTDIQDPFAGIRREE
jgi:hypothetical protein